MSGVDGAYLIPRAFNDNSGRLHFIHAQIGEIMDLIANLKTYVAVTETRSFSAVARLENTSQSAITRRIADLEAHFGVRLLHRTTRRLSVTPDGEDLLAHARHLIAVAGEMEDALGSHRTAPVGLVRFGTPVGFGNYLAAHLPELLSRHPGLAIELVMSDETTDMVAARLDIAARFRPLDDSSLVVRQIGEVGWLPVAAPSYLARRGTPRRPEELAEHTCLLHTSSRNEVWHFTGPRGPVDVPISSPLAANVVEALYRAALAGFGIALLPDIELVEDLADGRLVRILAGYQAPRVPVYLATPSRRHLPPRTRVVMDFVIELTGRLRARMAAGMPASTRAGRAGDRGFGHGEIP